ncbi:MAG: MMPL family transporter [Hymenobacteraceae bacterium]|nr:MMPL family transporter [Hymenobacteraceae bacterium]
MVGFLYRVRYWLLAAFGLACILLWPGVRAAARMDNSLAQWFLRADPALRAYYDFQARFGNDETVIIVVRAAPADSSLLTPARLRALRATELALARLPGVAAVTAPGSATVPRLGPTGAETVLLLPPAADGGTAARVRRTLARLPTLREQLFTPDYRAARILVQLQPAPDFDERRGPLLARIGAIARAGLAPAPVHLGGVGVVYAGLNELSQRDFGFFLGVGYLLMFLVLALLFRDALLVLYALSIVSVATWLTLGVYGALGYRLNLLSVLLPVIIILLGILDAMHVINERHLLAARGGTRPTDRGPAANRRDALAALTALGRPCLGTMLTTVAGFLALLASPIPILRSFGAFAALGIVLCLGLTYVFGVLLLPLARPRRARVTRRTSAGLVGFYGWLERHRRPATALSLALLALAAIGTTRLTADTYTLGYLPATHRVVQDHRAMQAAWGAYMPLELLVSPRPGRRLTDPAVVRAAVAFAHSLRRQPGVGRVTGFQTLYLAGLEARGGARGRRLLASDAAIRQTGAALAAAYPVLYGQFVHGPSGTGRITVSGPMLSARQLAVEAARVLAVAGATLGPVATVRTAGYQPMYAEITRYVTESQTQSLAWSLALVFGLVWAFVGSFRLALLTVVPNLFPVLVLLGWMGWVGIALDTATASIAAIVLSLCCDDTIHFIHYYRRGRLAGQPSAVARRATIAHVGPAILLTSLMLLGGYSFMLLGELRTVQLFGALTAIALVAALFGELVIFPLVLARFDRK